MTVRQDGASRSVLRSVGARPATQQLSLISSTNDRSAPVIQNGSVQHQGGWVKRCSLAL